MPEHRRPPAPALAGPHLPLHEELQALVSLPPCASPAQLGPSGRSRPGRWGAHSASLISTGALGARVSHRHLSTATPGTSPFWLSFSKLERPLPLAVVTKGTPLLWTWMARPAGRVALTVRAAGARAQPGLTLAVGRSHLDSHLFLHMFPLVSLFAAPVDFMAPR